jgi:hypothetical protein
MTQPTEPTESEISFRTRRWVRPEDLNANETPPSSDAPR